MRGSRTARVGDLTAADVGRYALTPEGERGVLIALGPGAVVVADSGTWIADDADDRVTLLPSCRCGAGVRATWFPRTKDSSPVTCIGCGGLR